MNPKTLIAPVLTGAIIAVAFAFYIKVIKKDANIAKDALVTAEKSAADEKSRADKAESDLKAAQADADAKAKSLADTIATLTAAKDKATSDLTSATSKVNELNASIENLKTGSAKVTKERDDNANELESTRKKLSDAETLKSQAEAKLKSIQADLTEAKRMADAAKDPGFLTMQYKTNSDLVRRQVEQLVKDVPDVASKFAGGGSTAAPGADPLRESMVERMVTLNIEGQFSYTSELGDPINDALTWSVGAIVIGMDANQVYLISTPPPHLLDQPAARNSLAKDCKVYFSVHPAGWSGVKDPLAATFLGVMRGTNATVGVFAVAVADWPQAREKPVPLIAAPTTQECRQWTVNGDVGFVFSRGVPAGPGSGPVRMDAMVRLSGQQDVSLVLPAQAVGYELGLFGTRRAPSDKAIMGVYYPEGNRILWLSDLYNSVKGMAAEMNKRAEVGAAYVSSDWVVTLGERPNAANVDTVITDFVNFIDKR